jgi:type VI secretion system secreted protein VgrG
MAQIQESRPVEITTPLGDDVLLFYRMTATEQLGRMFQFEIEMLSKEPDIKFDDILGQNVTVRLDLADDKKRYFNGFVSRFSQEGFLDEFHVYSATVTPWLWFLTQTADCRIFQEKTVPDIIKTVFKDHGFSDYEESLSGNYRKWEYCVQYRETDFNFVNRLMEQEGIYYYFKHEKEKHTLVLSDSVSSHEPYPGYETLPFFPRDENLKRERDHIYDWTLARKIQTGIYALNDFDFTRPKANLQVKSSIQRDHAYATMEIFDYPGEYLQTDNGETYARARIEEIQANQELVQAQGNALGLAAGSLFELTDYPREDQNREYLIISATHQMVSEAYTSTTSAESNSGYTCSITALPSMQPFRPARCTPKPKVQGPQTAIVVGPSGDEIHTDKYGRVKVSFHWDRYSKSNETSSCWVRVAQIWAGKQWGGIHIPRIGQEVIVDFLEGDPDHPIITGRVYNNDNMPPYDLPANATQSGIKSRSSKGGGGENFNEIRFEDKKGEELVYLHAEKNHGIVVENDRAESIGRDRRLEVGRDKSEMVSKDKTIKVDSAHKETIGKSMYITVGSSLTETVGLNYSETVGGAMELTIGGALATSVGGAIAETVGGAKVETVGITKSENIGKNKTVTVGKNLSESVDESQDIKIGKDLTENIAGKHREEVKKDYMLQAKKIQITADDQIQLKTGKAEMIMKKNGDITIKGKKINIKGSGNVIVKGSKIKEN